jgi:hypothetical protein
MRDEEIISKIEQEESIAYGVNDSELSAQRALAIDYYLGEKFGTEIEGRSQVVSFDVQDTIESALPQLLKVFVSGDKVVEFTPRGPDDQQEAEQETDYINHVVMEKNNGFELLYVWFKDALLSKNGYVKIYFEEDKSVEEEDYEGLTDAQVQMMASDDNVTIKEIESFPDPSVNVEQLTQQAMEQGADPSMIEVPMLHNVKIEVKDVRGEVKVCNVAPENILVSVDTAGTCMQKSRFVQHREYMQRATVAETFGLSKQKAKELQSDTAQGWDQESNARDIYSEEYDRAVEQDEVLVKDTYILVDGERWRYVVIGNEVIYKEKSDIVPFASLTPMIMPHRHIGRSYADLTMDIQLIKSTLLRGQLDNMYLANNGRYAISDRVNLDDMLTSRPGGIVRTEGDPMTAIMPLSHPPLPATAYSLVEYMDNMKEKRTGVTAYNQGLDSNSLNKTASGIAQVMSAAQQRIELVARTFAETGVKDLFMMVHRLVRMNYTKPDVIRLRSQWVEVDPRGWKNRKDLTISVGLGTGNKDQQLAHLSTIIQMQKEAIQAGLTSPEKIYNALAKLTQNAGFKNPEEFWTNPANNPPPEPQPSIEEKMIEAQKEIDAMKVQADNAQKAAELELKQQQMQLDEWKTKLQEETKRMIAQLNSTSDLKKTSMTINSANMESFTELDEFGAEQPSNALTGLIETINQNMALLVAQQSDNQRQVIESINRPKQVVRDKSGKVQGVI